MNDRDIPLANSKVQYQTLLEEKGYTVTKTIVRASGETQWHHHTNISDRFTVISGVLTVEQKFGDKINKVEVPDYIVIEPGVTHRVKNETGDDVVYIMVQSGGERDIVLEAVGAAA